MNLSPELKIDGVKGRYQQFFCDIALWLRQFSIQGANLCGYILLSAYCFLNAQQVFPSPLCPQIFQFLKIFKTFPLDFLKKRQKQYQLRTKSIPSPSESIVSFWFSAFYDKANIPIKTNITRWLSVKYRCQIARSKPHFPPMTCSRQRYWCVVVFF